MKILNQKVSSLGFYASGLLLPTLTAGFGLLLAVSEGAELRGEFALLFAFINLSISLLYSAARGRILESRNVKFEAKSSQGEKLFSARAFFSVPFCLVFFTIFETNLSFLYSLVLSLIIVLNGELILLSQRLLSVGRPLLSTIANTGAWLLMLICLIASLIGDLNIDIGFLINAFASSLILIYTVVWFYFLRSPISKNRKSERRDLIGSNNKMYILNSIGTIIQTNGLIILFSGSFSHSEIGVLSVATAILNNGLSIMVSILIGKYWLQRSLTGFWVVIYLSGFVLFSLFINQLMQLVLGIEFRNATIYLLLLLPYYLTCAMIEMAIFRSFQSSWFGYIVKFKFFSTLSLTVVFYIAIYLNFSFVNRLLHISLFYALLFISFVIWNAKIKTNKIHFLKF